MRDLRIASLILSLGLSVVCNTAVGSAQPPEKARAVVQSPYAQPLQRKEISYIEFSAAVEAVDLQQRLLTLKTDDGKVETLAVSEEVKRLNEVKVGDSVVVKYVMSIAMELREPTAEEKANPSVILDGETKAAAGDAPAAGVVRVLHAIVTVQAIDHLAKTVTVKSPKGRIITVKAQDPNNLQRIKVGDTIAVTYTDAVAVSLKRK